MISVKEKGEYLRGLLVLSRLDLTVSSEEKFMLIKISNLLGFDPQFGIQAVQEIEENIYINEKPPKFNSILIGNSFISDGLQLAYLDNNFHPNEIRWIRNSAKINGIENSFWLSKMEDLKNRNSIIPTNYKTEIEKLFNNFHLII